MAGFRDYLRVAEAAKLLGVSPGTLRNWDRAGRVVALRHPVNRYRLYRRDDLVALLRNLGSHSGATHRSRHARAGVSRG